MSVMQEIYRAARHSRKPASQRQRLEAGSVEVANILATGMRPVAYLDGKRIEGVTVADEIKGEVAYILQPPRLRADMTDVIRETRRGTVGIELEPL